MFSVFRQRERIALIPLVTLAKGKTAAEREEWMDDLRRDAPCVVARVEALLAQERASSDSDYEWM